MKDSKKKKNKEEEYEQQYSPTVILSTTALSKRELFAAIAMQGMIGNHELMINISTQSDSPQNAIERVTHGAAEFADALIRELEG